MFYLFGQLWQLKSNLDVLASAAIENALVNASGKLKSLCSNFQPFSSLRTNSFFGFSG